MSHETGQPVPVTGSVTVVKAVSSSQEDFVSAAGSGVVQVSPRVSSPRADRMALVWRVTALVLLCIVVVLAAVILGFTVDTNNESHRHPAPSPSPGGGSDTGGGGDDDQSDVWGALQHLRMRELARDTATVNASIELGTPEATAQADRARADADKARYSGEASFPNMESQPAMPYTNVGYAALGYDLLQGFPFPADGSVDPGFRSGIFDVTYRHRNVSSSGRLVPDGFQVVEEPSADFSFSYHMLSSASDLKSLTDTAWGIKGGVSVLGIGGASFSHNQEHQTTSENARNQESVASVTLATVKSYRASVKTPSLTPAFRAAMLAAQNGGAEALALLQEYGTHYVSEVQMGGRSTQTVTVSATTLSTSNTDATKSSWGAGAQGMFEDISGGVSGSHMSKTAREMRSMAGTKDASFSATFTGGVASLGEVDITTSSGGDEAADEDSINMESMSTWASSVAAHPVPVHYTLSLITELATAANFPSLTADELAAIRRVLDNTILQYCGAACADSQVATADEAGLVRYGDLVTITSTAGDLGEGLGESNPRQCWSYTPPWDGDKHCTLFTCSWSDSKSGSESHSFACKHKKRPIFLAVTQGGSLDTSTCTLTGANSDPQIMTLMQRNWDGVTVGYQQERSCTGFWCTNGHNHKYWTIAGSQIDASQDTLNVVYACMDGAASIKRILSPIPFKNLARRPVLGGESVIIAMRKGAITPATGADCGTTQLTPLPSLDLTKPETCQFTVTGVPVGLPFSTGATVRFGSNIAALGSTGGCNWDMWGATMPALLMDTPRKVTSSATGSSVLQTWAVPTNVEAIVNASTDPTGDNLLQAKTLVDAAEAAGAAGGPTFMVFDWTVVAESTKTTAQELGFSSAPISFQIAHHVVAPSTDKAVDVFGGLAASQAHRLGELVDVTVSFSEGVFLPYSRNNQYVATATGPQPALLASDFKITLTNQTDGCKSVSAPAGLARLDATAVWFEEDGRQPATYSLRAQFPRYPLLWPRCLVVTVPDRTQEATGRRIADADRAQIQPFELTPASLSWRNSTIPTVKIANVTFIDAVLNADLAPPQTYDFVASLRDKPVRISDIAYVKPAGGYNATLGVINMLMAVEVPPPGHGDGSDITLLIRQKRLRTASSPAVWLSPQQAWLSSPNQLRE